MIQQQLHWQFFRPRAEHSGLATSTLTITLSSGGAATVQAPVIGLVPGGELRIAQDIRLLPQAPQAPAEGSSAPGGIPIRAAVG